MMLSIALRHKQRCLSIQTEMDEGKSKDQAKAVVMSSGPAPSDHDRAVLLTALDLDLERLHQIESVDGKVDLKKSDLMPKYLPHVEAYLDSGARYPNVLLVWCAIWAVDIDELELAMGLADACMQQQQVSPKHFKRDLPSYLAEEIADWAERQFKADKSGSPYIDDVCARLLSNQWPSTNVISRGKAFKVAGLLAEKNGEDKEALKYFEQAQIENEKAGCKGRVKALQAKLGLAEA